LWLTVCLATQSNKELQQLRAWVNLLATAAPLLVTLNSQVHKAALAFLHSLRTLFAFKIQYSAQYCM
jgi:hypothetical protein